METLRYTVRREKSGQWKGHDTLVLLDAPATYGNRVCWDNVGGHGECAAAWYMQRTTKTPLEDAERVIAEYIRGYYGRENVAPIYCHKIPPVLWAAGA